MSKSKSKATGYVWVDAGDIKVLGDVRGFIAECDRLGLPDDTELADGLAVQVNYTVVEPTADGMRMRPDPSS